MTHHPTHPATLPQDDSLSTRVDRVDRIDWEPAHLTVTGGSTPAAVRHYIVGCRASALVLEREGHVREAGYLRRVAAAAEAAETRAQQQQPQQPTGGERR